MDRPLTVTNRAASSAKAQRDVNPPPTVSELVANRHVAQDAFLVRLPFDIFRFPFVLKNLQGLFRDVVSCGPLGHEAIMRTSTSLLPFF